MAILGIQNEIQKIAQTYGIKLSGVNPYTNLSHLDVANKWDTVRTALMQYMWVTWLPGFQLHPVAALSHL